MYEIFLPGRVPSKKNNKHFARLKNGRTLLLSSKNYLSWHEEMVKLLKDFEGEEIDFPIHITYEFYMPDMRKCDISNKIESINDLLVDIHFLTDDNWQIIQGFSAHAQLDRENPGCKLTINEI